MRDGVHCGVDGCMGYEIDGAGCGHSSTCWNRKAPSLAPASNLNMARTGAFLYVEAQIYFIGFSFLWLCFFLFFVFCFWLLVRRQSTCDLNFEIACNFVSFGRSSAAIMNARGAGGIDSAVALVAHWFSRRTFFHLFVHLFLFCLGHFGVFLFGAHFLGALEN